MFFGQHTSNDTAFELEFLTFLSKSTYIWNCNYRHQTVLRVDWLSARPVKQPLSSRTRHSILPLTHLAHEILAIDFGCAVCLQFDVRSGTGRLLSVWGFFWLMVGPLDPVASKLGQQNERKGASAAENLRAMNRNRVSVFGFVAWQRHHLVLCVRLVPRGRWDMGCSPLRSAERKINNEFLSQILLVSSHQLARHINPQVEF